MYHAQLYRNTIVLYKCSLKNESEQWNLFSFPIGPNYEFHIISVGQAIHSYLSHAV